MRGKLSEWIDAANTYRITPAGAGKTLIMQIVFSSKRDHPRRCGENAFIAVHIVNSEGSPPRMRGKRFARTDRTLQQGITPADAGKTYRRGGYINAAQDHPRGCGENV